MEEGSSKRFIDLDKLSFFPSKNKIDKTLSMILILVIIIAVIALIYVIVTPKIGENFTEFYILGSKGIANEYPNEFFVGQSKNITIGVANHEYKSIDYTIEIWLVNQTTSYDEKTSENVTIYNEMIFIDSIHQQLDHLSFDVEEIWRPQWEYNQSLSFNRTGVFKLVFLLYTNHTSSYEYNMNYYEIADEKINGAYRDLHLWIRIE